MSKRYDEEMLDGVSRFQCAIWFSILEALGPEAGARAADHMRDFGILNSDNRYCKQLCHAAAQAELRAIHRED